MPVNCPQCHVEARSEDVNIAAALGKCRSCHRVFRIPGPKPAERRAEVAMPPRFSLQVVGTDLVLARRWFRWRHIFQFAVVAVTASIGYWMVMGFINFGSTIEGFLDSHKTVVPTPFGMLSIFGYLMAFFALANLYMALAKVLNSTTIRASQGTLSIRHHPLPWPGSTTLQSSTIEQLYCRREWRSTQNLNDDNWHQSTISRYYTYSVYAQITGEGSRRLIADLDYPDQAIYIEQRLEQHLGIVDRPMRGELAT